MPRAGRSSRARSPCRWCRGGHDGWLPQGSASRGGREVTTLEAWARSDWATGSARGILSCRPKMMRWRRAWKASPSLSWRPISRRWRWAPPGSPGRRRPSTKPGRAGRRSVRRPPPGSVTARHRPGPRHPTASPISHRTRAGRAYAQGAGPAAPQDEATVILQGNGRFPCRRPGLRQRPQISPWCRQRPPHGRRHQRPCPLGATSAGATPGSGTASGGRALRGPGRVLNGGVVPDIALPVAMEIEGQYRPLPAPLETPYRHFLARCYRAPGAAGGGEAGRGSGPGTLSEGQRSEMTGTPLAVAALACRSS